MKNLTYLVILFVSNVFAQNIDLNFGDTRAENYFEEFDFEFVSDKIIVPVELEGVTYRFILDTGAPNIISQKINDLISPNLLKSIPITDASGITENLNLVSVSKLTFGNIVFENISTLVSETETNPIFECFDVDGFIGSNMLRNTIIQIDLEHKRIRLTDRRRMLNLDKNKSTRLKLIGTQSSPFIWVNLRGADKGREQLLVDTGADGLYDVSKYNFQAFSEKDIYKVLAKGEGAAAISLFGNVPVEEHYLLHLPTLQINGVEFQNCVTTTTNSRNSRIGVDILKYGLVTIDFINKRFYLDSKLEKVNVEQPDFNFSKTLKDDKLIVGFVWDKALKQKISYGDEIIAINDEAFDLCDLIIKNTDSEKPRQDNLTIKPTEGAIFEITVEKQLLTKNNHFK